MKKILSILFILLLSYSTVSGHDWYPRECCSGKDCKKISCLQLKDKGNTVVYKDFVFQGAQIRVTPDSDCHVCIQEVHPQDGSPTYYIPRCVFKVFNTF